MMSLNLHIPISGHGEHDMEVHAKVLHYLRAILRFLL